MERDADRSACTATEACLLSYACLTDERSRLHLQVHVQKTVADSPCGSLLRMQSESDRLDAMGDRPGAAPAWKVDLWRSGNREQTA